jgi:maleate isomerase
MSTTKIQEIDFEYAKSEYFPDQKVGLIALRTDHLIEDAMRSLLCDVDVSIITNRITFNDPINQKNLQAMELDLERAVTDLLPGKQIDVVAFGCSSGAVAIGEKRLIETIQNIKPGARVTNPVTAASSVFSALGVKKLTIITPYITEVNKEVAQFFTQKGLDILNIAGFNVMADADITRIDPEALKKAALEYIHPEAEALFLSCTALRSVEVIEELEEKLGIPVITSNQAMAWHVLQLLGKSHPVRKGGRIFNLDNSIS